MDKLNSHSESAASSRVCLLWVERSDSGTAAAYHLEGTLKRLAADGVNNVEILAGDDESRIARFASLAFRSFLRAGTCDLLIARWHPLMPIFSLGWKIRRKPVLLLVQGVGADLFSNFPALARFNGLLDRVYGRSFDAAHAVFVPHAGIGGWVKSVSRKVDLEVGVLPNGSPSVVDEVAPAGLALPERYAVFVGSLAKWQGLPLLLESASSSGWPQDLDLVIVGDGALAEVVVEHSEKHARIHYLGKLEPAQAQYVAKRARLSLSPKVLNETTRHGVSPFKLREAVALGVPYVASDVPGQREFVDEFGGGLAFAAGDADGLLDRVRRLASDESLRSSLLSSARRSLGRLDWSRNSGVLGQAVRSATGGESCRK